MVVVIWEQWKDCISEQFFMLYNKKILADVVLQVGKERCEVHSFVMALFSTFLQDILEYALRGKDHEEQININFTGIKFDAIKAIVKYMYSGEMTIEDVLIPDVLYLSKLLQIKGLEDLSTFLSESSADDSESPSLCVDREVTAIEEDENFDMEDYLMNLTISADIIPIDKQNSAKTPTEDVLKFLDYDYIEEVSSFNDNFEREEYVWDSSPRSPSRESLDNTSVTITEVKEAKKGEGTVKTKKRKLDEETDEKVIKKIDVKEEENTTEQMQKQSVEHNGKLDEKKEVGRKRSSKGVAEKKGSPKDEKGKKESLGEKSKRRSIKITTDIEDLNTRSLKKTFLSQLNDYTSSSNKPWPLQAHGVELLMEMSQTFCGRLRVNKGRELLDDTKNLDKIAQNRLRREMSYFWLNAVSKPSLDRRRFVMNISNDIVKSIFRMLVNGRNVVSILQSLQINTEEMTCCLFFLITSGTIPLIVVTDSYKVKSMDDLLPLYIERIEKAVALYQSTDLFLTDIAERCWVPHSLLKETIENRKVERIDTFDSEIQIALRLCGDGVPVQDVLKSENIAQYEEDLERILDHYKNRNITLPLLPYEERILQALEAACETKTMTLIEASQEYIVSYITLCKRALSKEVEKAKLLNQIPAEEKKKAKSLRYTGPTEPVISSEVTRIGQTSKSDAMVKGALLSIREGMPPDEAFQLYEIKSSRTRAMILFNVNRKEAPIHKSYISRFKDALDEVNINKGSLIDASHLHMVAYGALQKWFRFNKTKKRNPSAIAKFRKKQFFEEQIEQAMASVRAGMSPIDAYKLHGMRNKRVNLPILKYNAHRQDPHLFLPYETRLNMAIKAVRNLEMNVWDAGREFCVCSSSLKYYRCHEENIPSKHELKFDFEHLIEKAFWACKKGMSIADACEKFELNRNSKYRKTLVYNLERKDPPIEELYSCRLQKAIDKVMNMEMSVSEAADFHMVSYAAMKAKLDKLGKVDTYRGPRVCRNLTSKFDTSIIAAIKSVRRGMSIDEALKKHHLPQKSSRRCLEYNAHQMNAPIDVPYNERFASALSAIVDNGMMITKAARKFIVYYDALKYHIYENKCTVKNEFNFETHIQKAFLACRDDGLTIDEACEKFKINTAKYRKTLEYNLQRPDPPIDEPYSNRLQKAVNMVANREMSNSKAADFYMVSYASLAKHLGELRRSIGFRKQRSPDKLSKRMRQVNRTKKTGTKKIDVEPRGRTRSGRSFITISTEKDQLDAGDIEHVTIKEEPCDDFGIELISQIDELEADTKDFLPNFVETSLSEETNGGKRVDTQSFVDAKPSDGRGIHVQILRRFSKGNTPDTKLGNTPASFVIRQPSSGTQSNLNKISLKVPATAYQQRMLRAVEASSKGKMETEEAAKKYQVKCTELREQLELQKESPVKIEK